MVQIQLLLISQSTLISNTTNSSSIIQLATLSSYQPITPASYSGGSTSNTMKNLQTAMKNLQTAMKMM